MDKKEPKLASLRTSAVAAPAPRRIIQRGVWRKVSIISRGPFAPSRNNRFEGGDYAGLGRSFIDSLDAWRGARVVSSASAVIAWLPTVALV